MLVEVFIEVQVGVVGVAKKEEIVFVFVKNLKPGVVLKNSFQGRRVYVEHDFVQTIDFVVGELVECDLKDAFLVAPLEELGDFGVFLILQKFLVCRFFEILPHDLQQQLQTLFLPLFPQNGLQIAESLLYFQDLLLHTVEGLLFLFERFVE